MRNEYKLFLPVLFSCLLFSCVSADKYTELVQVKDYLEQENQRLKDGDEENRSLRAKIRQDKAMADKAEAEIAELTASFNSLNRNYQDLANRYNDLVASNKQIGLGAASEKQFLEENLAQKQLELESKERQLQTVQFTLTQRDKRIAELLQLLRAKEGN